MGLRLKINGGTLVGLKIGYFLLGNEKFIVYLFYFLLFIFLILFYLLLFFIREMKIYCFYKKFARDGSNEPR